jgi:GTPase SAR1 family protein
VLSVLQLRNNQRLVTPPPEVVQHGLASVKEYMAALDAGTATRRMIVRVIFVGWASAGKTKLNYALQGRLSEWEEGSTMGIDTAKWAPDWAPDWADRSSEDFEFRSWDFAGQEEYYAMHRIFLTGRAIYLLLVDVSQPPPDREKDPENARFRSELKRTVRFWLESLTKSTKKAIVRVVATKIDLLEPKVVEARVQVLLEEIAEEERASRAGLEVSSLVGDRQDMAREALANRPSLPTAREDVLLSSLPQAPSKRSEQPDDDSADDELVPEFKGSWGPLDAENSHQPDVEYVPENDILEETVGGAAPQVVTRSEECLGRIRDVLLELATEARFAIELPKSYVELMAAVEKKKRAIQAFPYMDYEVFRTEMLVPAGLVSEGSAEAATQLLHDLGIVLWFNRSERYADGQQAQVRRSWGGLAQRVFLDPQWVVDLLKPILGHRLEHQFQPIPSAQENWGLYWRERFKSRREAEEHREYLLR